MLKYALIADDLTGALDAGAGFARVGLRVTLPFSGLPADAAAADVVLVNTATRELSAAEAGRITRLAAERLKGAGIDRLYKKIDSVLRGQPGAELAAVLDVFGGRALVAPAFPGQGRTTRHGVQHVHGEPVEPYGGHIRDALGSAETRSDVRDAATDDDLAAIARAAAGNPVYRVWCGTAGLAAHAPAALGFVPATRTAPAAPPRATRVLVVAGSRHPATVAQVRALTDSGWAHAQCDPARVGDAGRAWEPFVPQDATECATTRQGELKEWLDALLQSDAAGGRVVLSLAAGRPIADAVSANVDQTRRTERARAALAVAADAIPLGTGLGFIMTGGDTALAVCRALGATAIHVTGEALPGIPIGLLDLPQAQFPIATKSGGFGAPDALLKTAEALLGTP